MGRGRAQLAQKPRCRGGCTVPRPLKDGLWVSHCPISLQPGAQAPTTHPGEEVDLEDGALTATAEHVMLS